MSRVSVLDVLAVVAYAWIAIAVVVALVRNRNGERRVLALTAVTTAVVGGVGLAFVLIAVQH